jgi:Prokaryotic homologs of the JAB domain
MALHSFRSADFRYGLTLPDEAVRRMLSEAIRAKDCETGGVLVGLYNATLDTAIVTLAAPPPPDSREDPNTFWRGVVGVREMLQDLWTRPIRTYYLGEWHVHPGFSAEHSGLDDQTMYGHDLRRSFQCAVPVLVILGGDPATKWHLRAWAYPNGAKAVQMMSEKPGG